MIVVSNSTPLINLAKLKRVGLLKHLFNEVYIPRAVYNEVVLKGESKVGTREIKNANWIKAKKVADKIAVDVLLAEIDKGEAEVIVLAKELKADLTLIDDPKARRVAKLAKLKVKGTLGILSIGYKRGLITNLGVELDNLKAKKTFISDQILLVLKSIS